MRKIIRNAIQCKHCGDIIESVNVHDYVTCSCGACSVDGGHEYLRRSYKTSPEEDFINLSKYADIPPCTPGEVLKEEFLMLRKESLLDLRIKTDIPGYELNAVMDGTGRIDKNMADKLADYFHNIPEFWMNLQKKYDEDNLSLASDKNER